MIVWTGLGFLVAIIGFGSLIFTEYLSETIMSDPEFYQNHSSMMFLWMLLAAGLTYLLDKKLSAKKWKIVIDKETWQEIELKTEHSLFFIATKWWPHIFAWLGVVLMIFK